MIHSQAEMLSNRDILNSTGLNLMTNSLGFLIKNQTALDDTNTYIVFPAHCLPQKTVFVPFLIENVTIAGSQNATRSVMFKVIGLDKLLDLAVAVFDTSLEQNMDLSLNMPVVQIQPSTEQYSSKDVFRVPSNNLKTRTKLIKTSTIQNFHFNGPTNMIQFFYPKSLLIQQNIMSGGSGAPVVDQERFCIGMVVNKIGDQPKAQPTAIHGQLLYNVIFHSILPNYLIELQKAQTISPNINDSVSYVASYISNGVDKAYLGWYGQYNYVGLFDNVEYPELKQLNNTDGFVVLGIYPTFNLVSNQFTDNMYVKTPIDNNNIRVYSPFNPRGEPSSFLYNVLQSNAFTVRIVVVTTLSYVNRSGITETLHLGSSNAAHDSLSTFMYNADTSKPFTIQYSWYSTKRSWVSTSETIQPVEQTYRVNATNVTTLTTDFPPFVLGNETVGNAFNMTLDMKPYFATNVQGIDDESNI